MDAAGNLYVGDNANNRVLEYNTPLTTDTVADRVFGQGASQQTPATCHRRILPESHPQQPVLPEGVAVDAAGNLYVADRNNSRVLEYNTPLTVTGDTVADRVFGQPNFASATCNLGGDSGMCQPDGVAVDAAGNLYVADNNRVLEYNTPLTTDTVADRVFGQGGSFTSNTCNLGGISASSLCFPVDVAVDAA